jgi:hypothetical protein
MSTETTTELRRCVGSTHFGIEAHDADASDFPVQASAKDGLGRMCKPHWRAYTNALHKAAVARKTAEGVAPTEAPVIEDAEPGIEAEAPVTDPEAPPTRR